MLPAPLVSFFIYIFNFFTFKLCLFYCFIYMYLIIMRPIFLLPLLLWTGRTDKGQANVIFLRVCSCGKVFHFSVQQTKQVDRAQWYFTPVELIVYSPFLIFSLNISLRIIIAFYNTNVHHCSFISYAYIIISIFSLKHSIFMAFCGATAVESFDPLSQANRFISHITYVFFLWCFKKSAKATGYI